MLHKFLTFGEWTWAASAAAYSYREVASLGGLPEDVNTRLLLLAAALTLIGGHAAKALQKLLELYKSKKTIDSESDHGKLIQAQAEIIILTTSLADKLKTRDESHKDQVEYLKARLAEAREDAERQRAVVREQNDLIATFTKRTMETARLSTENTKSALSKIPAANSTPDTAIDMPALNLDAEAVKS